MTNGLIEVNPHKLSGTPVFSGTRVPIQNLFDYLEGGDSIDDFLDGFPPITREHVIAVLQMAEESLVQEVTAS
jgi:uncharacterized protein (DUF433 family)